MHCKEQSLASVGARLAIILAAGLLLTMGSGCNSFLDQSEVTRGPITDRLIVPILDSIDPLDDPKPEFSGAEDAKPEDLKTIAADYLISRNDLITVSIFDLVNLGVESVRSSRVSETGMLSLPMLPEPVSAVGLSETQLQKAIANKYKEAGLLPNAQVAVTVVEARGRTFNITGAVMQPGQYAILDSDFRIMQALVLARDTSFPSDFLYVIRKKSSEKASEKPSTDKIEQPVVPTTGPADLAPRTQNDAADRPLLAMVAEPAAKAADADPKEPPAGIEGRFGTVEGKTVLISPATQPVVGTGVGNAAPATQPADATAKAQPAYEFGTSAPGSEDERVIRVALAALKNGDLRQNIVVRPGDVIYVPQPLQGVYYMHGHVGSPGAYNFAGQKVSLMNAVAAARGLGPMAVPSRTDVIRRIGADRQVFVRVDLWKIFEGRESDIFLKPNDMVQVGTDFYPPFLQAVRGAFRITYGFGFLYDRNYAPSQVNRYQTP